METKLSDIVIIGSGPSGIISSLILASNGVKVTLIERESSVNKLAKRILVSGNGRANFFNDDLLNLDFYNGENSKYKDIVYFNDINYGNEFLNYLSSLDFPYIKEGKLYYPYFNRAESLHNVLVNKLTNTKAKILFSTVYDINFKNNEVLLQNINEKSVIKYKKLVLATGGKSYDRDNLFSPLEKLNIEKDLFSPCLCPVIVKEKIPSYLASQRLKAKVNLLYKDKIVYSEIGEIIFKKDGLSGICIFNSTLIINEIIKKDKNAMIKFEIDYMYSLNRKLETAISLPLFLAKYLKDNNIELNSKLYFTFSSLYPFKDSQVSYGGISLNEIDLNTFELKKYKNIYAIGEILSPTFICGGYNMGLSFIEGYKFAMRYLYDNK